MQYESFQTRTKSGVAFFSHTPQKFSWFFVAVFLFLAYAPFLGDRVVRPAGDDKVYVSQAIEMAQSGSWFLQTLGGEPNYYKGPLHYIFLRLGITLFGDSIWATVYMNLLLLILGAIALGAIVHRNMREFEGWSFWVAAAFGLSAGIYSHTFASQMEVELAAIFAIGAYFLDRSGPGKGDIRFWIVAGLAGLFKSPLHSLLLGITALLFWGWTRELLPRARNPGAWGAALLGVLICVLGYMPAFLYDQQNFVQTYILRETLWKPANGAPWHYPIIPLFTYSLLPWMLPAFVAFFDSITRLWRKNRAIKSTNGSRRVVALGLCLMIPSIAFFIYHPYRGQNYNLPVVGGLFLWIAATWATRAEVWTKAYAFSLSLTAIAILIVPVAITFISRNYDPMPFWWPSWLLPVLWLGAFLTARGFFREGVTFNQARPASLARRSIWLFLALGFFLSTLGEREMIDIRLRLQLAKADNEKLTVSYYNLQKNIWSEWGYLNFQIPYPVSGLFTTDQLKKAIQDKHLILVPGEMWLEDMRQHVDNLYPGANWEIQAWRRWKTKGKNAQGVPAWKESWEKKDLSLLEKKFYMVRISLKN